MDATEAAVDDYFSTSSIDNPPREPKEGGPQQEELFHKEEHEQEVESFLNTQTPERFEFKLTLTLKANSGNTNPITLPVAAGACYSERIEEILDKQFCSARFRTILRSIVGDPQIEKPKKEEPKTEESSESTGVEQ